MATEKAAGIQVVTLFAYGERKNKESYGNSCIFHKS